MGTKDNQYSFEDAKIENLPKNFDPNKRGNLSEFYKVGEKKEGNEAGILAKKRGYGLKPTKNPDSKKYEYRWMIKYQELEDTLNDYLGTAVARFFVGDRAPKNKVIKNSQGEILIASRMIEGFRTIFEVFRSEKPEEIWRAATGKKDGITGIYEIKALHDFIANPDDNY